MKTVFATFNFKNSDLVTAEKLYIENHVRLTLQLPNLRQYITGLIQPHPQHSLAHRAAFNYFDDAKALHWALHRSPAARPLLQDGAAHLRVNRWLELDSDIILPFEGRQPGQGCFVLAAEFELKLNGSDPETAEKHFRDYHLDMAGNLPNLRHFMISKYQVGGKIGMRGASSNLAPLNPLRMATLVFDTFEAFQDASYSAVGMELRKEQQATFANTRVYRIEATVQR